jgi:hypothetical protein
VPRDEVGPDHRLHEDGPWSFEWSNDYGDAGVVRVFHRGEPRLELTLAPTHRGCMRRGDVRLKEAGFDELRGEFWAGTGPHRTNERDARVALFRNEGDVIIAIGHARHESFYARITLPKPFGDRLFDFMETFCE